MRLLVEIALIVLAGIGVAACVALLPKPRPTRWRSTPVPRPPCPDQLVALERLVNSTTGSTVQVHAYLRPVLVEIAARRLAGRGQSLERMPASAGRELLGDRLWEIVRPHRPFPEDRYAPGVTTQDLGEMLEVLERL